MPPKWLAIAGVASLAIGLTHVDAALRFGVDPLARDVRRSLVLLAFGYLLHLSGALRGNWEGVFQVDVLQVTALALMGVAS